MKSVLIGYVNIKPGKNGKLMNKDVWTYFDSYVKTHFSGDLDIMLFNNETLPNLSKDIVINRLNSYDNIIVSGREPLKYLLPESDIDQLVSESVVESLTDQVESDSTDDEDDEDKSDVEVSTGVTSTLDNLRYYGIKNTNPNLTSVSHISVIYSLMFYLSKDAINTFHFDILNRINKNPFSYTGKVNHSYVSVDDLALSFYSNFYNSDGIGFDIESRGFPENPDFRLLGFSFSDNDKAIYYYFDRDDSKYELQLETIKPILSKILSDQDKFKVYNCKFENYAIKRTLGCDYYFHDTFVYPKILKTYGSLKFNANLFLNIPIWNEDIHVFMKHYKNYVSVASTTNETTNTGVLLEFSNKFPESFTYLDNFDDEVEGKFLVDNLFNYYKNNYNEWQVVPVGLMGKYCNLDSSYTYQLFKNIYSTDFQGVKQGFKFYNNQSALASILESNGVPIDIEYFNYFKDQINNELTEAARNLLKLPNFHEELMKELVGTRIRSFTITVLNNSLIDLTKKKSPLTKDLQSGCYNLITMNNDELGQLVTDYFNKVPNIKKLISESGQKISKTLVKKYYKENLSLNEFSLHNLLDILNTKKYIGFLSASTQVVIDKLISYFIDLNSEVEVFTKNKLDEYQSIIDNFTSYKEVEDLLNITSPLAKYREKYCKAIINFEDNKLILLKFEFFSRFRSVLQCSEELLKTNKENSKDNDYFKTMMSDIISGKDLSVYGIDESSRNDLVELLQKCKSIIEDHLKGEYFTKELVFRYILSWTHHKGCKLREITDLNYGHQVAGYVIRIKQLLKIRSSVIHGKLGGEGFIKSLKQPLVKNSGDNVFYKVKYFDNMKYTSRWSSPRHCFLEGTKVYTTDGIREIKELYESSDKVDVVSINDKLEPFIRTIKGIHLSGTTNESIIIEFDDEVLECTPDHRFMTISGVYIEARSITKNTKIRKVKS
jgi:hypothetical protein